MGNSVNSLLNFESLTIPDLEERHKIPEGYLDKRCSHEDILTISTFLKSWNLVAQHIGLSEQQIEAIEKDSRSEEEKRLKCLMRWREKDAFMATYRKLLQALLKLDYGDTADKVCQHLAMELKASSNESTTIVKKNPEAARSGDKTRALCCSERGSLVVDGNLVYFSVSEKVYTYNTASQKWESTLPECPQMSGSLAIIKGLLTHVGGIQMVDSCPQKPTNKLVSLTMKCGEWEEIYPPMPTCRCHTAAARFYTCLIVAGGTSTGDYKDSLDTVEVLDSHTLAWSAVASLPHPISHASAVITEPDLGGNVCHYFSNRLYVLGGNDKNGKCRSVLWCKISALLGISSMFGGKLSQSDWEFVDSQHVWHRLADLPVYYSTGAALGKDVIAVGGCKGNLRDSENLTKIYEYSDRCDQWVTCKHMTTARAACYAVVVNRMQLLVVGGHSGSNLEATDSVEFLDLSDVYESLLFRRYRW